MAVKIDTDCYVLLIRDDVNSKAPCQIELTHRWDRVKSCFLQLTVPQAEALQEALGQITNVSEVERKRQWLLACKESHEERLASINKELKELSDDPK